MDPRITSRTDHSTSDGLAVPQEQDLEAIQPDIVIDLPDIIVSQGVQQPEDILDVELPHPLIPTVTSITGHSTSNGVAAQPAQDREPRQADVVFDLAANGEHTSTGEANAPPQPQVVPEEQQQDDAVPKSLMVAACAMSNTIYFGILVTLPKEGIHEVPRGTPLFFFDLFGVLANLFLMGMALTQMFRKKSRAILCFFVVSPLGCVILRTVM